MTFSLHPRLAADTMVLGDLGLSRLLLMNDARYPWLILVPRRLGLVEIVDLPAAERTELMEEIARCSQALRHVAAPLKLNVGALGNLVTQLHIHILARFETDPAWPGPVWGRGAAVPYDEEARLARAHEVSRAMGLL